MEVIMNKIYRDYYCRNCDESFESEDEMYFCPKCDGMLKSFGKFLECECGEIVELNSNTNWCNKCERLYNLFGQELAPVEEWDEQDRYDSFSPYSGEDW